MPGRARIEDLLARYCLAWDEADLEALADCFTSDATLTLEVPRAGRVVTRRGKHSILAAFAASTAASTVQLRHVVSNIAYDPTGGGVTTVMAYQPVFVVAAGGGIRLSTFSCLDDRVIREGGGWRFKSRRLVFDTAIPTTTPFFTAPGAEEGNP